MKIKFSQNLIRLARLFEKSSSLFVTGEYVFNSFSSRQAGEIRLLSFLSIEEVFSLVENTEFIVKIKNAKEGEIEISCENEKYIYLPFAERKEDLLDALVCDSKKRDFTINAIYCKILTGDVFDVANGIKDAKNKVLRCCDADACFSENGLNILNAIYLSSLLEFEMNKEMVESIQRSVKSLKVVSGERKFEVMKKVLFLDSLNLKNAVEKLSKLDLFKFTFYVKGYNLKPTLDAFPLLLKSDAENRLMAFFVDYYMFLNNQKPLSIKQFINQVLRDDIKCSASFQKQMLQIISGYLSFNEEEVDFYIANNVFNIDKLVFLFNLNNKEKAHIILSRLTYLREKKVPLLSSELKISFNEIKQLCGGENRKKAEQIQRRLVYDCVLNPELNAKEKLIKQVIRYI